MALLRFYRTTKIEDVCTRCTYSMYSIHAGCIAYVNYVFLFSYDQGGFQLLDLIILELKSHLIPYKFKSSHWLKLHHSDWRANLVKDFFLQINFPPMRALEFIRDHVTFKLPYDFSYHMKTPLFLLKLSSVKYFPEKTFSS